MEVQISLKKSDLIHFNFSLLPRDRSTYISILFIAVLVCGFLLWQKGLPHTVEQWAILGAGSFGGGIGGMFAGFLVSMIFIIFSSTEKNGILGHHTYEITSDGLHEITDTNESVSKWEGIQEVRIVGSYFVFRISSYLFHIIPFRSFCSQEVRQEFIRLSLKYWRHAHLK